MMKLALKSSILVGLMTGGFVLSNAPIASAATQSSTVTIDGTQYSVQTISSNQSGTTVQVSGGGQTITATYDKATNTEEITQNGQTTTISLNGSTTSGTSGSQINTPHPQTTINQSNQDLWWGDDWNETFATTVGTAINWSVWCAGVGGWNGYQTSTNSGPLQTYQAGVNTLVKDEEAAEAAAGLSAISGAVAVLTAPETAGIGTIIAGLSALGLAGTALYELANCWTDHQTDKSNMAQVLANN